MGKSPRSAWRRLESVGTWLLGVLILFEEWGWRPLVRTLGALARLPPLAWLERRIARLPAALAVVVLFVPALLLLPVKVAALWLLASGRIAAGVATFVIAKLAGTAVVARLFLLTRPQLMRLAWFAALAAWWTTLRGRLVARVRASRAWRIGRLMRRRWRRA